MQNQPQELLTRTGSGAAANARTACVAELAADRLRLPGALRLRVTGSSMLPAMCPGDVVFVRACAFDDARTGDIVAFARQGRIFVHRVTARRPGALVTRGDSNPHCDDAMEPGQMLGKVVRIARKGRAMRPVPRLHAGQRAAAALFRTSPLAGRLFTRIRSLWMRPA